MKKLFVTLLALAMLLPMALTPVANAEVTAEPYYLLGWSDYDNAKFPYLEGLVTNGMSNIGENIILSYGGARIMYGSYTDEDVTAFAQAMKKELEARPVGMRYWHFYGPAIALKLAPEREVFLDHGVKQLKELCTAALKKMSEIGCPLEGIVVDTEYIDMGAWYIQDDANKDKLFYKKLVADPRYAAEIRPLLVERGFKFYHNITDHTPEIYGLHTSTGNEYAISRSVWNTVMRIRLMNYLNDWCYTPLQTYYPGATMSDYQSTDTAAWLKSPNDAGDVVGTAGGNTMKGGNTSNYNFYSSRPNTTFYATSGKTVFKNPVAYNEAVYEATPYNMFRYDMNLAKRMLLSTDTKLLSFWLGAYDYGASTKGAVAGTPYYAEEILHLGLYDPQPFLGYIYDQSYKGSDGKYSKTEYEKRLVPLNEMMAELTRVAGFSDKKPIELPMNWNSEFMLTGMYCGGRNLWRITPNTELVSKEAFKIAGSDPTFRVAGQTVTFPGGKIIADGNISVTGTCGYWVETSKDVTPVIKNDADRLEKIPAYIEDFERYQAGTKYTSATVKELGAWTIVSKGNDLLIEAEGNNKVLSVTGNASLENTQLPANVTIADHYATQQIWEITVTVPAGMTADQSLTLLQYVGNLQLVMDVGFRISDGKVYYTDGDQHKMLFDIAAGGKYTFRRALDFKNFTCDYIVLDKTGKEVASAKGVAIPAFTGKVTSVKIACENVTGKVLLDNYILRATGAAADFETYDAKTGLKLEAGSAHSANAAYRLSWSNISESTKTVTVMADITANGKTTTKTVKEVKLERGCDGVETGIVEVKAGETVKIYLKTDTTEPTKPAETAPTQASQQTAPTKTTQATSATKAPTQATKAPTKATGAKITRPTNATQATEATEATKVPTQATKPLITEAPTQATSAPTELTEITGATEITGVTEATEATEVTETTEATEATTPEKPDDDTGTKGPNVGLIIAIVVVILAAAGACVYFFVIKKKPAAPITEEKTEE